MKASHVNDTKLVTLPDGLYEKVKARVLISPRDGSDDLVLRLFEVGQGGHSADHAHDYPHYVYIVDGQGILEMGEDEYPLSAGSYAFINDSAQHQLINTATDGSVLKFLCLVPREGHKGFPEDDVEAAGSCDL